MDSASSNQSIRSRTVDPKILREYLLADIVEQDLPFSMVESGSFRAFTKCLNPDIPFFSKDTLVSDLTKLYLKEKEKLKQVLANIPNRICLTYDVWTAATTEEYIFLTAHFVDENWKLNSKILCFDMAPYPPVGVELAEKVFGILKEWGIEKKVFSLTLDNTSIHGCMRDILKEQLSLHDSLFCDEFFHIRCSAHVLNVIAQDSLEVINLPLQKIRESVEYVKGSKSRVKKIEECASAVGNLTTNIGLKVDVFIGWKSTYLMLDSAIKYKKAFLSLQLIDRNYKVCPSAEEWERCEKICEFLEPFYDITNLFSKFSYPTSNLYFIQILKIEAMLKENLSNEDALISDMCRRMKEKFDEYWNEYSMVLAFGAVLDPRIKLSMFECLYSKVENDPIKCQEKMSLVKTKLYNLFEHYVNATKLNSSQPRYSSIVHSSEQSGKRIIDEIKAYESQIITNAGKSQLDLYLEEPIFEISEYEDLDVLEYWKNHMHRYPILALMARDVLAIPITTVVSESTFSIGARVLTKYKDDYLPEKVEELILTRNWLHGYIIESEEQEEEEQEEELNDSEEEEEEKEK